MDLDPFLKMKNKLETFIFILLTIAFLIATHTYVFIFTPPGKEKIVKTIFIPQGASFRIIARELEASGVITDADKFGVLAEFKGALKKIKAGEYDFTTGMLPMDVLDKLVRGEVKEYNITIPEGYNIIEIAELVESHKLVKKEEFIAKAMNKSFAASMEIDGATLEGYLFPDTYRLTKGMAVDDIIKKMVSRFNEVYYEIRVKGQWSRVKMSKKEIVTLASIIEKETGTAEERPLISAVVHNRLKKGMRLDSDPTVIYGIKNFNGNITKKDLETETPYNTYRIYGLPPGPIANPGKASLEAAINPVDEGYLYFVAKNNGTHHFSKDIKEHATAVNIYQKKKTGDKI